MNKYKVGDTVHVVECGNLNRGGVNPDHYDKTITKVGRKYFYINHRYGDDIAFEIDSGRQKTEYCENFRIVESEQSYLEEDAVKKIADRIGAKFNYGCTRYSLTQLKAVAEILEMEV